MGLHGIRTLAVALLLLALVWLLPRGAFAQYGSTKTDGDSWRFAVAPYIWLVGIHGDQTVKGFEASVDMDFGDLWSDLDFAGQLKGEAWKGNLGLFLDGTWLKLSTEESIGPIRLDVDMRLGIVEAGAFYHVYEMPLGAEGVPDDRKLAVQLLAGARYWYLKAKLDTGPIDVENSRDWVDPILGARLITDITERTRVLLRMDIGGFGVGSASEFAFNATAMFGYRMTEQWTLAGGYQVMTLDHGSGSDPFQSDLTFYGPIFGVGYRF